MNAQNIWWYFISAISHYRKIKKYINMTIKEQKAFFDIFIVKNIIKVCRHIFKWQVGMNNKKYISKIIPWCQLRYGTLSGWITWFLAAWQIMDDFQIFCPTVRHAFIFDNFKKLWWSKCLRYFTYLIMCQKVRHLAKLWILSKLYTNYSYLYFVRLYVTFLKRLKIWENVERRFNLPPSCLLNNN